VKLKALPSCATRFFPSCGLDRAAASRPAWKHGSGRFAPRGSATATGASLLRREGWEINLKKTHPIYNELGLQLREKTPKRRVKAKLRDDRREASPSNETGCMAFVHDQLATGQRMRVLTVVDSSAAAARRAPERALVSDPCRRPGKVGGLAQLLQRGSTAWGNRQQAPGFPHDSRRRIQPAGVDKGRKTLPSGGPTIGSGPVCQPSSFLFSFDCLATIQSRNLLAALTNRNPLVTEKAVAERIHRLAMYGSELRDSASTLAEIDRLAFDRARQ